MSNPPPITVSEPAQQDEEKEQSLNGVQSEDNEMCLSPGYKSYSLKLLLQLPTEYDTASHDDLSADEAYDLSLTSRTKKVHAVWQVITAAASCIYVAKNAMRYLNENKLPALQYNISIVSFCD